VREIGHALLGDRWTTLILLVLAIGSFRHAELQRDAGQTFVLKGKFRNAC
jgi:DNA-binding HxlR family transcriptional regulator